MINNELEKEKKSRHVQQRKLVYDTKTTTAGRNRGKSKTTFKNKSCIKQSKTTTTPKNPPMEITPENVTSDKNTLLMKK